MSEPAIPQPNEVASEVVDAPSKSTAIATLEPIEKIEAGLAELEKKIKSTSYDLSTGAGERTARQLRAQCVAIRSSVDDAYELVNRPMLQLQKDARALRDSIKAAVKLLEDPLDSAISAQEEKKKAAAVAKQQAEKVRVEGLQTRIEAIRRTSVVGAGTSSIDIESIIAEVHKADVSPAAFDEWASAAYRAKSETLERLRGIHAAAVQNEADQERNRRDREELERLRREQAERDAETARQAAIEAAARAEAERVEHERVAAAQRAESERLAAERAAHEAKVLADREEQARIEEQAAAQRRIADEQARVEREAANAAAEHTRLLHSEISGIQQQSVIAAIGRRGVRDGGTVECIEETLKETEAWVIDAEYFGVLAAAAQAAKDQAIASIRAMLSAAQHRAESDRVAKEAREAEELRQSDARAELERKQQEIERAAREAREAQERKDAAERAEQQRLKDEADAAEREVARVKAEQEAARLATEAAARTRIQKAAPALLTAATTSVHRLVGAAATTKDPLTASVIDAVVRILNGAIDEANGDATPQPADVIEAVKPSRKASKAAA